MDRLLRCIPPTEAGIRNEHATAIQGGQAKVALEALRGDKTIQRLPRGTRCIRNR